MLEGWEWISGHPYNTIPYQNEWEMKWLVKLLPFFMWPVKSPVRKTVMTNPSRDINLVVIVGLPTSVWKISQQVRQFN